MEEKLRQITSDHRELRQQVEESNRKQMKWMITAIITAFAGAGGTGGFAYLDQDNNNSVQTVLAAHIAGFEAWQKTAVSDLETLQEQNIKLLQAVAALKAVAERGSRRHRDELSRIDISSGYGRGGMKAAKKTKVNSEMVQKKILELF